MSIAVHSILRALATAMVVVLQLLVDPTSATGTTDVLSDPGYDFVSFGEDAVSDAYYAALACGRRMSADTAVDLFGPGVGLGLGVLASRIPQILLRKPGLRWLGRAASAIGAFVGSMTQAVVGDSWISVPHVGTGFDAAVCRAIDASVLLREPVIRAAAADAGPACAIRGDDLPSGGGGRWADLLACASSDARVRARLDTALQQILGINKAACGVVVLAVDAEEGKRHRVAQADGATQSLMPRPSCDEPRSTTAFWTRQRSRGHGS